MARVCKRGYSQQSQPYVAQDHQAVLAGIPAWPSLVVTLRITTSHEQHDPAQASSTIMSNCRMHRGRCSGCCSVMMIDAPACSNKRWTVQHMTGSSYAMLSIQLWAAHHCFMCGFKSKPDSGSSCRRYLLRCGACGCQFGGHPRT
jgi:hypothetical protein